MDTKSKFRVLALLFAGSLALALTGCGKRIGQETEKESETVKITEPPTERETQTEKPTEAPETESETETETEPQILTAEEEKEQETEFSGTRTFYAADDINVRSEPSTDDDTNIISSFDQGEKVTVSGETKNWYKIEKDGYSGYVHKEGLSEDEVEPKSDEERQRILEEQGYGSGSSPSASDVDAEYGVQMYADSFSVRIKTDANIRSVPRTEGEIVGTVSSGSSVTALGETDRWYKVDYDGVVGYVNKNLIE